MAPSWVSRAILVIAAGIPVPVFAASLGVPITIRSAETTAAGAVRAEVKLTPLQVANLQRTDVLSGSTDIPGLFAISTIPEGTWMIEVSAPGLWHPPAVHTIGKDDAEVPFRLWRTATIAGSVSPPKGDQPPRDLVVRFQSSPSVAEADRVPPSEVRCPVVDLRWTCEVPAGVVDIRARAVPYQTSFRWDVPLKAGERQDWGELNLRRGTAIVGIVALGPGMKENELAQTRVLLEPSVIAEGSDDRVRRGIKTVTAKPSPRGFFHLDGVAPGDYNLVAVSGRLRSRPVLVRALTDKETEVLKPLILEEPRTVTIRLFPARDPDFKPWRIRLMSPTGSKGMMDPLGERVAGDDGGSQWEGLHSGSYKALISSAAGARWAAKDIEVGGHDVDVTVEIPVVRITGSVTLGSEPIAATLQFGGETGEVRVSLQSDDEGAFEGFLPRRDVWDRVSIESATPALERTLVEVPVRTNGDGKSTVDIRIPATHLTGEVVDEKGNAVEHAIVRIDHEGKGWGVDLEVENGAFETFGQPDGEARVQATGYLLDSEPVRVHLREEETTRVRLVLKSSGLLAGRIVSISGPVAGARVVVFPTDTEPLAVIPFSTNAKGEFAAVIQPGTREADVFIEANGYAAKMFHYVLPAQGRPLEIPLDPSGGALTVKVPKFDGYGSSPEPYLVHNGATQNLRSFATAAFDWASSERHVTVRVPLLERGIYSLCLASEVEVPLLRAGKLPAGRCKSGFLPPLGELALNHDQ